MRGYIIAGAAIVWIAFLICVPIALAKLKLYADRRRLRRARRMRNDLLRLARREGQR